MYTKNSQVDTGMITSQLGQSLNMNQVKARTPAATSTPRKTKNRGMNKDVNVCVPLGMAV